MNIETTMVEFEGIPGYLCRPQADTSLPSVVVIQEWWGLNDHIKDVAERLAKEGFVTLAPDLYRGVATSEPDEARKLSMELDRERAIADIQGAVNYLRNQPYVEPKKAGVMGFCMGGGLSLWMALQGEHIGVAVVFYGGRMLLDDETAQMVDVPILGHFGEKDGSIPLETIRANEQKLHAHGKTAKFNIYPDAPHAFFNDTRESYRSTASQQAWAETLVWFRKYLGVKE